MCRNIRQLYNFEPPATEDEIEAAAVQFVRKISGFNKPSAANLEVYNAAIAEITSSSKKLLASLKTNAAPRDRETEREKAMERNKKRFGAI